MVTSATRAQPECEGRQYVGQQRHADQQQQHDREHHRQRLLRRSRAKKSANAPIRALPVAHARVDQRVRQVGNQIDRHHHGGEHQVDARHDRVVPDGQRIH